MNTRRLSGSFAFGLLAIALGLLLLLGNFGFLDTGDVFRWVPSLFILLGVWMLVKNRFRQVGGPILMIVVAALIQIMVLGVDIGRYWPVILIGVGAAILVKSLRSRGGRSSDASSGAYTDSPNSVSVFGSERKVAPADQDSINLVSVMGSAAQRITSPEFRGGRATAVMGEAIIDLRESAIQEKPAVLEFSIVMGEIKLRVPRDWNVRVDDDTIMGELKDERLPSETGESQTDLVIKGSVVMGSLKIED